MFSGNLAVFPWKRLIGSSWPPTDPLVYFPLHHVKKTIGKQQCRTSLVCKVPHIFPLRESQKFILHSVVIDIFNGIKALSQWFTEWKCQFQYLKRTYLLSGKAYHWGVFVTFCVSFCSFRDDELACNRQRRKPRISAKRITKNGGRFSRECLCLHRPVSSRVGVDR